MTEGKGQLRIQKAKSEKYKYDKSFGQWLYIRSGSSSWHRQRPTPSSGLALWGDRQQSRWVLCDSYRRRGPYYGRRTWLYMAAGPSWLQHPRILSKTLYSCCRRVQVGSNLFYLFELR